MSEQSNRQRDLVFRIPDGLPYAEALGLIRRAPWPAYMIARRLEFIDTVLAESAVPGAKGQPVGPFRDAETGKWIPGGWELVPIPDDLRADAEYLAEAVADCRATLEAGDLEASRQRMNGIEHLVSIMAEQADPDRRRGGKTIEAARSGGHAKNSRSAEKRAQYQAALDAKLAGNPNLSVTEARRRVAADFNVSTRTVQRHTSNPRKK